MLKAKILDATRRALLAQRITHMGTQTDPFKLAVLMREKTTDIQKDLIGLEDKSMETDGAVTLRQECPGGCKYFSHANLFLLSKYFSFSYNHTNHWPNDRSYIVQRYGYTNTIAQGQSVVLAFK